MADISNIRTGTPEHDRDAAPKKWAEDTFAPKEHQHETLELPPIPVATDAVPPANGFGEDGDPGVRATYARADHKHATPALPALKTVGGQSILGQGDIPLPSGGGSNAGIYRNVREMFDIPSQADITCVMKEPGPGEKPMIHIHGTDTSGETNPLRITPKFGFGSYYDRVGNSAIIVRGLANGAPVDHRIEIIAETNMRSVITIPAACDYFDITYFAGSRSGESYWVDTDGVYHSFSAADTPIGNFGMASSAVIINGVTIPKGHIAKISFGSDYASTTILPNRFLEDFVALSQVDLSAFVNVETIGMGFMYNCTTLTMADLSSFVSLREVKAGFLGCYEGWFGSLFSIYIGGVDWSQISVLSTSSSMWLARGESWGQLAADTIALGQAFKNKFPGTSVDVLPIVPSSEWWGNQPG